MEDGDEFHKVDNLSLENLPSECKINMAKSRIGQKKMMKALKIKGHPSSAA
jgi:hypothetical protein